MTAPLRSPVSLLARPSRFGAIARARDTLPGPLHSVTIWGDGSGHEAVTLIADCGGRLEIVWCGPLGGLVFDDAEAAPEDTISLAAPFHAGDAVVLADGIYNGDSATVFGMTYGRDGATEAFVGGNIGGQGKGIWRKTGALRPAPQPVSAPVQSSLF